MIENSSATSENKEQNIARYEHRIAKYKIKYRDLTNTYHIEKEDEIIVDPIQPIRYEPIEIITKKESIIKRLSNISTIFQKKYT